MTTCIYEPLDYCQAQIRLLHVLPLLDYSEPIRISLQNATIPRRCLCTPLESDLEAIDLKSKQSDNEKPDFIALSYVWGSPDNPSEVFVESAPEGGANTISITRNLDIVLRHMGLKTRKPLVIWIDAICIDQGNLEERSHQVAMMDSIYTIARGTVVWLGPEEDNSHHAMELLAYLGERVFYHRNGMVERHRNAPPREPNEPILESMTELIPYGEKDLRAIISFLERPWFTRLWVRQEITLASQAVVQCGRTKMDWANFQNGTGCFCRKPLGPSVPDDLRIRFLKMYPAVRNVCDVNIQTSSYETLRRRNKGVRFTDPRDSIYAVKSLLEPMDQELDVWPNYLLEAADVFMDVCVRIVKRQRLTYFLESCELNSISVPNLPSWVPDWSNSMTAQRSLQRPWSACGFISANATYLRDRILRVSGIQIDKIESVRDLYDPENDEPLKTKAIAIEYIWDCYPGDIHIDSPYDENQSMTDAYCRTFTIGMSHDSWDPPNDGFGTFDEAKQALKKIWSLEEDCPSSEDLRKDPLVTGFLDKFLHFSPGRCFFTAADGYVGLAPLGTQPGDIISVILGCDLPVILREDHAFNAKPDEARWKVVGVCYVNGLMSGEAIYGSLPSHYRAVISSEATDDTLIRGAEGALLDSRTNDLKTDPAAVLEEFGIQPGAWNREPHRLEVSETVLREAGVDLRNFFLI